MHAQFDHISYLSMHMRCLTDELVPAMISLLKGMPNLNTLHLKAHPSLNIRKPKVSYSFCCFLSLSHIVTHIPLCLVPVLEYGAH